MKHPGEILDPYADPEDGADAAVSEARSIRSGTAWRMLRTAVILAGVLGVGIVFVRLQKSEAEVSLADLTKRDTTEAPSVNVLTVESSRPSQILTLPGETAAWDATTIYSRVSGYVAKWLVDIGDKVSAGQILAQIDTPELDAELVAANAKLAASVAHVAVKKAQADFAETTEQRWRDSPKGSVSDQERESKKAGKAEAVAELAAAHAQVALEQAEVDRLTALKKFKEVRAPFGGTIIQRHVETGALVTAGSTTNTTSLYELSQNNPLRVFIHVPQSVAADLIENGARAEITSTDRPTLLLEGSVSRTSEAINPKSRTLRVEVDLPNLDNALIPGMYVQVKFHIKAPSVVQIPAAALMFKSGGPQVAVVDDHGVVSFRDVTIARDNGTMIAISSGLKGGDRIALNISSQIVAGTTVKSQEVSELTAKSAALKR